MEKISVLNPNKIGSRRIIFPVPKRVMEVYAAGLSLVDAQFYNKEDSFIGKYEEM